MVWPVKCVYVLKRIRARRTHCCWRPVLLVTYGLRRDFYMVVDHQGIVRYRTLDGVGLGSRFNEESIRTAIIEALDDLHGEQELLVYDEVEPVGLAELSEADIEANRQTDAFFGSFINENAPGGAVVVLRDDSIVHQAAYGLASMDRGELDS